MKLFNVTFLLHTSYNECYVVAENCKKAEELVLSFYKKKYNSTYNPTSLTIKEIKYIADTDYYSKLTYLIIEERRRGNE